MYKLLHNGKIILRGTYRQCISRRFEMRRENPDWFSFLVIVADDVDPDGSTGYAL